MEEKIINKDEVGLKYFNYVLGKYYVYNSSFKAKEVFIDKVVVIEDRTTNPRRTITGNSSSIVGAILAGFIGVIVAAMASLPKWDVDLDIYLTDGRVIEICTQNEKLIRSLYKYIPEVDPRRYYRETRANENRSDEI
jgi:hypothetical protein